MPSYLRFTPFTSGAAVRRRLTVLCALAGLACGGAPGPQSVSPQSMNQTLDQFFAAVKANDLQRMGALWGTERGPANDWMKSDELRQRLSVIQRYLAHVGYRVIEGPLVAGTAPRHLVHQAVPRRAAALERPVEVRHAVADVVDPRPPFREEFRDRPRGIAWLEQLDVDVAERQAHDGGPVGGLGGPRHEAEDVAIERQGLGDAGHRDAHVGDAGTSVRHMAGNLTVKRDGVEGFMAAGHPAAVSDATFAQEVEQHRGLAIVDFWATWWPVPHGGADSGAARRRV